MIIKNKLGNDYEVELITKEQAIQISTHDTNKDFIHKIVKGFVDDLPLASGFRVDIDLNLSTGKVEHTIAQEGSSSIANHFVTLAKIPGRYDFDDFMEDALDNAIISKTKGKSLEEFDPIDDLDIKGKLEWVASDGWDSVEALRKNLYEAYVYEISEAAYWDMCDRNQKILDQIDKIYSTAREE